MRVLFAFDRVRRAILLAGGDKSEDWKGWYVRNIPVADERFEAHQAALANKRASGREEKGRKR